MEGATRSLFSGRRSEPSLSRRKAFGSRVETWIRLQTAYDIAQAQERKDEIEVERYAPQPA
ncbi:MAG: hypothetical protein OXG62_03255 [Nitrospinae bacterium]|nr:hypothetical protein [Nitrospinota bacterium]